MLSEGQAIRTSPAKRADAPVRCGQPFSFYSLSDQLAPRNRPFHRFLSLMRKLGAKAFLSEVPEYSDEEAQDDNAIAVRCQCTADELGSRTTRLSFFRNEIISTDEVGRQTDEDFLGFCVLRQVSLPKEPHSLAWVYEAVARWTPLLNNFLHCCSVFDCRVADRVFRVRGSYFAQQNGLTYVCCQSALKMALMHMRGLLGHQISYADINAALGIDHRSSGVGTYDGKAAGGVQADALEGFLSSLSPHIGYHEWYFDPGAPQPAAASIIYPYVESGYPVLLFFKGGGVNQGHVVTVVGHTCNSDSWTPLAEMGYGIPQLPTYGSSLWADHFIVQDDNFGMYMCLARDCLCRWTAAASGAADSSGEVAVPHYLPEFAPFGVTAFLPREIVRSPLNAELVGAAIMQTVFSQFLPTSAPWQRRLREAFTNADEPPVLRTFLVRKPTYVRHLETMCDWDGERVSGQYVRAIDAHLPEHFWLTEISLRDLYSGNRRKLGELISDCSIADLADPEDFRASWLALRVPGIGLVRPASTDEVEVVECDPKGHTDLLRLPCPQPAEW